MNAPLSPEVLAPPLSARRARWAAHFARLAISGIRGVKTFIGKARGWLPACDLDLELQLLARKLLDVEKTLIGIARRLEATAAAEQQ